MERPIKKLWRKIGLQKNFLQGTSHSDESKNTLSQFQQSLIKSQCSDLSLLPQTENLIFQVQKAKYCGENHLNDKLKQLIDVKNQTIYEQDSCQTPIDRLNISNNDSSNVIWQIADDTIQLAIHRKHTQSVYTQSERQSASYFDNFTKKQSKQDQKNSISQTQPYVANDSRQSEKSGPQNQMFSTSLMTQKKGRKQSIDSIKIRLHGVEEKQSETNESQYAKNMMKGNNPLQNFIQPIYSLEIMPKQLEKYQKQDMCIKRLKKVDIPRIYEQISNLRKSFGYEKSFILQEINIFKEGLTKQICNELSAQMQQLTDQIGYLYSQNREMVRKLEQKQSLIKKHHEQYTNLQQKITEYTQSITSQHQQKEAQVVQLQNQVNRLEEKLQDLSDLQTKIQSQNHKIHHLENAKIQLQTVNRSLSSQNNQLSTKNDQIEAKILQLQGILKELKARNQQLEASISVFLANQRKLHQLMDQKTFDLSATIIKNQELEWEINELYTKNQQLQYNFRKQLSSNIQKLENQHFNCLNLQKCFFEKEKLRNKELESNLSTLTKLLNESLKYVNLNHIEVILKQYNTDMSEHIYQIFSQAISSAQSSSRVDNHNENIRTMTENLNELSPGQPENDIFSSKNLRRTGYFGQVTKSTLAIRLDDIQKKISAQVYEDQRNPNSSFGVKTSKFHQNKVLFRGDTFSQISEESFAKEGYAYRTIQPTYPRNDQSRCSIDRHSRHGSDHIARPDLEQSITQDLQRVKLSLKQQSNRNGLKEYQKQTDIYDKSNDLQQTTNNQNINYSFSQTNWHTSDENDDGSSVTSYKKSQNKYNRDQERYQTKKTNSNHRISTERSQKSDKSNSERQDIIQKIKERVKQKLRSKQKQKKETQANEPTYASNAADHHTKKNPYYQTKYEQPTVTVKKEDLILADFYQRHSIKNPMVTQHQTERKMSPLQVNRSPSNTRSRSPSSSSTSRMPSSSNRGITAKYSPISGVTAYGVVNKPQTPSSLVSRTTFSRSMVDRPQLSTYSKRINPMNNTTATYQTNTTGSYQTNIIGSYQPKSGLYSINRGEVQSGSSYGKKY